MKKLLIGASALFVLISCGQEQVATPTKTDEAPALKSGIGLEAMDTSVRPGDDFFAYVNGTWVEETEIPADKASYGVGYMLYEEAQENVKAIIETSATGDFAKGTDEQKVGDLYKSYMDMETRNASGVKPLKPLLDQIDALENHDDLAVFMASAGRRGIEMPLYVEQFEDLKDPKFYAMNVFQGGLGLPDREYYFTKDEKSEDIRAKYTAHIEKMFDLAGFDGGAAAAGAIMALETRIADKHVKKEDARNWAENYNKVALEDLGKVMPRFNWGGYLEEAGIADIGNVVIFMTDYLGELDEIIQSTDLDTWKNVLVLDDA